MGTVKQMNPLAALIDDFLYHGKYNKTDIAKQLGITRQGFYNYLRKDNFTIDDANRILAVIGHHIDYDIKPININTKETIPNGKD